MQIKKEFNEAVMNAMANRTVDSQTSTQSRVDRNSIEFSTLKELAHKFCLSFGPDPSVKSREAIVAIHQ
jgi:hypothetical protein